MAMPRPTKRATSQKAMEKTAGFIAAENNVVSGASLKWREKAEGGRIKAKIELCKTYCTRKGAKDFRARKCRKVVAVLIEA